MYGQGSTREVPGARRRARSLPGLSVSGYALVLVGSLVFTACGARSGDPPPDDATDTSETETETDTDSATDTDTTTGDPEAPLGSCANPIVLPFKAYTVRGRLLGRSEEDGWCGDGENDRGAEDIYRINTNYDVDVYFKIREETDFEPVIRVEKEVCGVGEDLDEEGVVRMCTEPLEVGAIRTFFAEAKVDYYLTVDSPRGVDGRYGFDILYGPPPIEACDLHPSTITQQPGGVFLWENDLPAGQGYADGPCGGPGTENTFALEIGYPGAAFIEVTGDVNVDIRTFCGGTGELACMEGNGLLDYFFEAPGTYYLNVDQASHNSSATYSLRVTFD